MKTLLSMILTFCVLNVYSQFKYLKVENERVIFEEVYIVDSTSTQDIEKLLTMSIPSIKNASGFNKQKDIITFKLNGSEIDFKKYGTTIFKVTNCIIHPIFADVSIVWKDNKYKVLITNIKAITSGIEISIDNCLTGKKNQGWSEKETVIKSAGLLERHLDELFKMNKIKSDW